MTQDATDQVPPRLSGAARWLFYAGGVAIPVALLLLAGEADGPSWQDGTLSAYSTLVLHQLPFVFWGFFAYSIGAMALLLASSDGLSQRGRSFAVRFGIHAGVLLSIQLIVQFVLVDDVEDTRILAIIGNFLAVLLWPAALGARWLTRRVGHERLGVAAAVLGLIIYVLASLAFGSIGITLGLLGATCWLARRGCTAPAAASTISSARCWLAASARLWPPTLPTCCSNPPNGPPALRSGCSCRTSTK